MIDKIPDWVFVAIFTLLFTVGSYVQIESSARQLPLDLNWLIAMLISAVGLIVWVIKPR